MREFSFLRHASSPPGLLFLWLHQAQQNCWSGGIPRTYRSRWISADINTDALGPAIRFESNSGPIFMPAFCFRAKRADELVGELWLKLYKELLIWLCWLHIAHLLLPGLQCIANPFLSDLVNAHGFGHQSWRVDCITCPRQSDLPTSTFFLCHR